MFTKLLIANRGEIAVRIERACRDLDVSPIAVYSDLDVDSLHVRLADEALNIGPGPASRSYLEIPSIIAAASRAGAQAVHPGYGFLAENATFARAVMDAGLTWIGPPPEVIDAMGDKTAARRAASDAGVAIVPGTTHAVTTPDEVRSFARRHGLPVAIKASAGGGGKGFRVVSAVERVEEALSGAAREAQAYFSSGEVYLERYLDRPRHVEVQVLGDRAGAIISWPERDCSLQRRHQKLIEESPSPVLRADVREAIMAAAARVSKQVGYRNAGTCEFLLDEDGATFYFLEMNTRLQVEHPVTELVSNVDLVKAQMLVAAGEALGFSQDDVELRGHAIECRINAEDPARNFMPAPGVIAGYKEPSGPGVRVDSGIERGAVISQSYDPLMAKLITYGADRDEARRRMLRALDEYEIDGITTTIPWHRGMLDHDRFVSGGYSTGTVEREMDLLDVQEPHADAPHSDVPESAERRFVVEVDGKRFGIRAREALGVSTRSTKPKPPEPARIGAPGAEVLVAPMQGTIVKVLVDEGQSVEAGQIVCVLEAMKMENAIVAAAGGTVEEVYVEAGQPVEVGAAIAVIR